MTSTKLQEAIADLQAAPKTDIKGKKYATVATRVEIFRKHFGHEFGIKTKVLPVDDLNICRVRAQIVYMPPTGGYQAIVASGLAEENMMQGKINATSALENAETSAIGRALASFGLLGGEYASANELVVALAAQEAPKPPVRKAPVKMAEKPVKKEETIEEFKAEVAKHFPPEDNQYSFYIPTGNTQEEVDELFKEVDRITSREELSAYWKALDEVKVWLLPADLIELSNTFGTRKKQLS